MKRRILLTAVAILAVATFAWATATQTLTNYGSFNVLEIAWTTAAGGTFTEWDSRDINGWILGVETVPDGTATPTANYDVVLTNKNSRNICGDTGTGASPNSDGILANRSDTTPEYTQFLYNGSYGGHPNEGSIAVNIANAGNSKQGKIRIYYYGE